MRVLYITTWFPYPLNQGGKIREYHLLRAIARQHETALISFQDSPVMPAWVEHMRQFCKTVEVVAHNPFSTNRLKLFLGWFSPRPSSVFAGYSHEMTNRVENFARSWKPECVIAYPFPAAEYALLPKSAYKIMDADYPMAAWLYEDYQKATHKLEKLRKRLAWKKFFQYERWLYPQFDLCLVSSQRDQQALIQQISPLQDRVKVVPNGVDLLSVNSKTYAPEPDCLIFNGSLRYRANFDAIQFFLTEIFPLIQSLIPGASLKITGSTEGVPLQKLPSNEKVIFTGYLENIHTIVAKSWACVVPLRSGGGTRLKILEAMAVGTPVISTSKGAEGLEVENGKHLFLADTAEEFAQQTVRILKDTKLRNELARNSFRLVEDKYDWNQICASFTSTVLRNA